MKNILKLVRTLGPVRLAVIGGTLVALIGFFAWIIGRVAAPQYALLYGDLDMTDSGRIVAQLESGRVPYQLSKDGAAVYVPSELVARTRVTLAEQGLPAGGSIGYEIFDSADTLGSTNFMQNVNLVRALEGELARTIRSIDGVKGARVHLVLPKRELFSRERQEPSASVLLHMRGNARLTSSQILAVQHLVASAVSGMNPDRISIVDGKGMLLTQDIAGNDGMVLTSTKNDERRREFENRLARTVEQLLEKTVGLGKVRAEVFADMDFDRINTSEEVYDPDGQVVRSTQSVEESTKNSEADGNLPVSVATNLPDAQSASGGASGSSASENRTEETVNYEISKKVINHVREAGVIKRLSVAVLVDGAHTEGPDRANSYQPRPQAELDQLAALVRSAIGFDGNRGDTVEVINMRFVEPEMATDGGLQLLFGLDKGDLFRLAQYLVLIIFGLLVLLLIIRPLVKRAIEAIPLPAAGARGALLGGQPTAPALAAPGSTALVTAGDGDSAPAEIEHMINLDRVEGRVKASSVKKIGEIVDKHPEEAISILRSWLHAED